VSVVIKNILDEEYKNYLIIGGMPACVSAFLEREDYFEIEKIQDDLLYSYEQDFKKYRPQVNEECLLDILLNTSKFIGGQIIYTKLSDRFTSPTVKKGLELLKTARLLISTENVSISRLPFTSSGKQFKVFYLDIGLMVRKAGIGFKSIYFKNELGTAFQGVLAEQFVAQQMAAHQSSNLKYWARTEGSASSEVDFVVASEGKIIPIEVKAGKKGALKSLNYVLENYPNIEKAIVYSNAPASVDGKIHFLPIWFAGLKI
jgi:predicted AAA+ superfamily ATPase